MDRILKNRKFINITFFILLSLLLYIVHGFLLANFIIDLPLSKDAVVDTVEYGDPESGTNYAYIFKNDLEEAKHYHNEDMRQLNKYFLYGLAVLGFIISYIIQVYLPKRFKGNMLLNQLTAENLVVCIALAFLAVYILPLFFDIVIPHNRLMPFLNSLYEEKQNKLLMKYNRIFQ